MEFKYFQGPINDMSDLIMDKSQCSICGKTDYCFKIDYALTNEFSRDEKKGKIGCYSCLKEGRLEFWHDTEFGLLDAAGLRKVYLHNIENPPPISPDKLSELRRTPQILSIQQELWLTHCEDFMIYKGRWEPGDFYANSKDGDGRNLFMEMTNEELNHLWEDNLTEGNNKLEDWDAFYYVFECAHCRKLRGNWDCD